MAQDNKGGLGPEVEEHLKQLKGTEALLTGHLEGVAEAMGEEGQKLIELAKSQLLAGFMVAEKAIREHLPQ